VNIIRRSSFVDDLLKVLSPGRRKLAKNQNFLQASKLHALENLINEYQSLAKLRTYVCKIRGLRSIDYKDFREFIIGDERNTSWELAQLKICQFKLPEMVGGVNPGDQRLIFHLQEYLKPIKVLEIGTHIGASTAHVAVALKSLPNCGNRKLSTVDIKNVNCTLTKPWRKFGSEYSPSEMIHHLECSEMVEFITKPSIEFLENDQEKYDLIFLDGDHSAKAVYREIPLALDRMAEGGCILLHDYFPDLKPLWNTNSNSPLIHSEVIPGVFLAVQRLLREGCEFVVHPLGELPWKTKLGSNITSLALLSRPCGNE